MSAQQLIDQLARCTEGRQSLSIHPPGAHTGSAAAWMVAIGSERRFKPYEGRDLATALTAAIRGTLEEP